MTPLVSIITPTLNSAALVGVALRSVLQQDVPWMVEHIIVDGASADGTLDEVERLRGRYEERGWALRVHSAADRGIYDALNRGMAMATGEIIGVLGADDRLAHRGVLSLIGETFLSHPAVEAVYGDIAYERRGCPGRIVRRYSSKACRRYMMLLGFQPPHPTLYCRRSVYERFGAYDTRYRISGDFDFMLRAILKGGVATWRIPRRLVVMSTGGTSDRSWRSHLLGLWEHQLAYVRNRVPGCIAFELLQLLYKAVQCRPEKWSKR